MENFCNKKVFAFAFLYIFAPNDKAFNSFATKL